ncbi:MAG: OB-fold nucleic acid binding domain-containing protein [Bacilli bacterium]|nr:OB-fold nucleic acid binding domain-containing protein [Bacilli bacterium]
MKKTSIKVVDKRVKASNAIKNVTIIGQHIDGHVTKVKHIGSDIKNIILEGKISKIEILELDGFGMISAKLNDGTGSVVLMMWEKGNLPFRELVSKIHKGKSYRVFGNIREDLVVLGKNIELISDNI